jgi:hypothetical protein
MKTPLTPALLAELRKHDPSEPLPAGCELPEGCTTRERRLRDGGVVRSVLGRIAVEFCPRNAAGKPKRLSWRRPWTYGGLAEVVDHLSRKTAILKVRKVEADKRKSPLYVPSVKEAADLYLADPDVAMMRSLRSRRMHMARIVKHLGGAMLVTSVTGYDLQRLIIAERDRGLSKQSLVRQKAAISSFLTWLSAHHKITEAERLEILKEVKVPKSARTDKRKRTLLMQHEYFQLIDCQLVPLGDRARYAAALAFGGRESDMRAWCWRHIDTVDWRRAAIIRPKTGAEPVVHELKPEVAALLREWFMASGRPGPDRPVFGRIKQGKDPKSTPGSKAKDSSSAARRLRRHLLLAGVDRHELHHDVERTDDAPGSRRADFHSFRRLLATGLARAGVGTRDAMELLGWTSPAMYARYQQAASVQVVPDAALFQRTPDADTTRVR